jgi:hypothetical protein
MWKQVLIVIAVVAGLALLVFGWDKSWSYVKGTQQVVNEEVDERSPMRFENARITSLIEKENSNVLTYEDRICDLEARRDGAARAVAEGQKRLQAEGDLLKRIKGLLDEKRERYVIGPCQYTYAEVNADALERLEALKRMQEDITFNESLVRDLDTSIKQGRGSLAESRKRLVELNHAMVRLEARNANADVRLEVAKLANAIAGAPLAADSELEKACHNYERRVAQKERRAESRLAAGKGQFRIDYSAAMVTQDASAEIAHLLGGKAPEAVPAEAPKSKPSAADALESKSE